jgi:protease-4
MTQETVLRGRNAALFSEARPWDAAEQAKVQALMVAFYQDFVDKAARGRNKKPEEIHAVAQGRVWTGQEALERGLVDKLGGFDVALEAAKFRAKIGRGQEVSLVVLPERKGWFELLMERQEEEAEGGSKAAALLRALPSDVRSLLAAAVALQARGPMALLPFDLTVR